LSIEMALSAGAIFVPNTQYSKELSDFRNCFPDAAADVPWSNRLPRSIFAEALMGLVCGKQPGILKADQIQYWSPAFRTIQQFGPLALLHISFPTEANCEANYSKWADLRWTHVVKPLAGGSRTSFDDFKSVLKRRCHRKCNLLKIPEAVNDKELTFRLQADNSEDWEPVGEDLKLQQGLQVGDIVSILIHSGEEEATCHIIGLAQFSYAYKQKGQKSRPEFTSNIYIWCHYDCVKNLKCMEQKRQKLQIKSLFCLQTQQSLKGTELWGYAARLQPSLTRTLRSDVHQNASKHPTRKPFVGITYEDSLRNNTSIQGDITQALAAEVAIVNGPPGTGKTFQAGTIVSTIIKAVMQKSDTKFWTLWVTWSNAALHTLLKGAIRYGVPATTCILVCKADQCPSGIDNVDILELDPSNLSRWQEVFSKKTRVLNIFCTIGQTLNAPGHYQKPLDLFDSAFNFLVVDEAGQVLEGNGQHLGKYASQIFLAGDVAQLPAYCYLPDEHHALMRAAATSVRPILLTDQHRQNQGLSTFNSFLSYRGLVQDAINAIPVSTSLQIIVVLFDSNSMESDLSSVRSAELAEALWKEFQFTKDTARIITPYARQKFLHTQKLGRGVCEVVDGVQGIEVDHTVLDLGRDHGIGFLRDPRRINVAHGQGKHS